MTSETAWWSWFEDAVARSDAGDLAFMAEEAPDPTAERLARNSAVELLLASNSVVLAEQQLMKLLALDPANVEAAGFQERLNELQRSTVVVTQPPAFIFGGHIVDAPDRRVPRFPRSAVDAVANSIRMALAGYGAVAGSPAFSSAAAGGDLLFVGEALALGMEVTLCLPFAEHRFVESSVSVRGPEWEERYESLTHTPAITVRTLPLDPPDGSNPYERCNRWMVCLALASGKRQTAGIVVWDGRPGDGRGGASHLAGELTRTGLPFHVINPLTC